MTTMMIMKKMTNEWLIMYCFWDGMVGEEILGRRVGEQDMHKFV
jgi:hypothetical protein